MFFPVQNQRIHVYIYKRINETFVEKDQLWIRISVESREEKKGVWFPVNFLNLVTQQVS